MPTEPTTPAPLSPERRAEIEARLTAVSGAVPDDIPWVEYLKFDRLRAVFRSHAPADIRTLLAEVDRLTKIVTAVDDALVVNWCLREDGDYRLALHDLVTFNTGIERHHIAALEAALATARQERDAARESLAKEERDHFATIGDRDLREEQISNIAAQLLGVDEAEWSSNRDLGEEALEAISELQAERDRLLEAHNKILALNLKKDERGRDDFYSGADRFFTAWQISDLAIDAVYRDNDLKKEMVNLRATQCCDPAIDARIGVLMEENTRLKAELAHYKWRPIAEIHEDFGPCVLMNIFGLEDAELGSSMDNDFDALRWTHFAEAPKLSNEDGERLLAEAKGEKPMIGKVKVFRSGGYDPALGKAVKDPTLCSDCPPLGYPTDVTRCDGCPRLTEKEKPNGA